jgi:hypothetical protein
MGFGPESPLGFGKPNHAAACAAADIPLKTAKNLKTLHRFSDATL